MIFNALYKSSQKGELIIEKGGMCHWHLRKNGQITIREIIVLPEYQRMYIGTNILKSLKSVKGAKSIFSKCPAELPANNWYKKMKFELVGQSYTSTGRKMNHWELSL